MEYSSNILCILETTPFLYLQILKPVAKVSAITYDHKGDIRELIIFIEML